MVVEKTVEKTVELAEKTVERPLNSHAPLV